MADYRSDLERFLQDQQVRERDAKHVANLVFLAEYYGPTWDVLKNMRRPARVYYHERAGRTKRLPSVHELANYRDLTDEELAEVMVQKISAWDELEDAPGLDPDFFA